MYVIVFDDLSKVLCCRKGIVKFEILAEAEKAAIMFGGVVMGAEEFICIVREIGVIGFNYSHKQPDRRPGEKH